MYKIKLSQCGNFVTKERVNTNNLNVTNYITTDNMLPNKEGICNAEKIPISTNVNRFYENDILLSNIRPYFKKIWKAQYSGGCSADVLIFRTNKDYDADFIKYCLSQDAFFDYDMKGAKGSKMPRGDKNHILNYELYDFSLLEQKKIADILKSLDNKIELNNKINQELEQMAKSLYEYWFVQFDFLDEKGRPYKSANGKMVYNDILKREIPAGWEVGTVSDVCEIKSGYAFSSNDYSNDGIYKLITIKNVLDGYISTDTDNFISTIPSRMPEYCLLKESDILLSLTGNVGRVGMVHTSNLLLNQRVGLIVPRREQNHSYLYLMFSQNHFKQTLEKISTGSNQKNLSPIETEMLNIPIIPNNIMFAFNTQVQPLLRKIISNTKENEQLIQLRDFLLPLLMNGQVSVSSEH